jgi:hypothetical protein
MPVYTFKLRDGSGDIEDSTGVQFHHQENAFRYAHDVVYELMKSRELETRSWRLDVYEGGSPIYEIPFVSVDQSLDHLPPKLRTMVEGLSERRRQLGDALHTVKATVQESRALVARSRGKPYLASRFGKAVIRDT